MGFTVLQEHIEVPLLKELQLFLVTLINEQEGRLLSSLEIQ